MSTILEVKNLKKAYDNGDSEKLVLENINLTLEENEFLCILGPSGCGKTTFLRCLAGFEKYSGKISVRGKEVSKPDTDRIMVFQDFNQLFPWKTAVKNIELALKLQGGHTKEEIKRIATESLAKVNLKGYENYYPYQLSGGMKQRVAIAKAIALKPDIILMDEPFAALDAMTRNTLQREMLDISEREKCTIIFITHNIQEAITMGTRILLMHEGGKIAVDEMNPIARPVLPSSPGYGEFWDRLHDSLYTDNPLNK